MISWQHISSLWISKMEANRLVVDRVSDLDPFFLPGSGSGFQISLDPNFTEAEDELIERKFHIMEDQYHSIYLSILLKSYLAHKRSKGDGVTQEKSTYDRHT